MLALAKLFQMDSIQMINKAVVSLVLNDFTHDSRVQRQARAISTAGYKLTVVALHETGLEEHELLGDIKIHRIKLSTRQWGKAKFLQLVKYIELLCRVVWLYRGVDVIHCHDLPALPIGCLAKWVSFGQTKLIYDAHEYCINDYPYESKLRQRVKYGIERAFINHANGIITVSDSISALYQRKYHLSSRPIVVLNCPSRKLIEKSNILKEILGLPPYVYLAIYQGSLSPGRGIQETIDAFKANDTGDIAVVFMGYGVLTDQIIAQTCDRVFHHPAVSPDVLHEFTASADCGIALIEDSCISYRYCLPNKLFEYFMAGLPAVVSNLPEMEKVVTGYKVGEVVISQTKEDILKSIEVIRSMNPSTLSSNIDRVNRFYNWENQIPKLMHVYEAL
jgi:glycosyltransferase involved in cell wall biosynthesis